MRNFLILIVFFGLFSNLVPFAFADLDLTSQRIESDLKDVHQKYKSLKKGKNADYIPALAEVDSELFGIAVVTAQGKVYTIGDATSPFSIQSISKAFIYGLALKDHSEADLLKKVGVNATGFPFNSLVSIELNPSRLQNPLVNAGAIQTVSLIRGKSEQEKWQRIQQYLSRLAGHELKLSQKVFDSEMSTNDGNRSLATRLRKYNLMYSDIEEALKNYTKQCSLLVTAKDLAVMGASLANAGMNPITHDAVLSSREVRNVLSVMTISGLYEESGTWFFRTGLPAKSGVGGGIVAVVPGRLAIAAFSPRLDEAGNSVKAQAVIQDLVERWKLHLLESR
jgi:glutaminase